MERLGRISRRGGITRYHQLYTFLRRALVDGAIIPGSLLPSETQLMQQYQISRNTVRRALAHLAQERLVVRLRGSGTYARNTADPQGARARLSALAREGEPFEHGTVAKVLQFAVIDTPEHILRRWPAFGPRCTVVQRTRSYEGEVFAVCTSHVAAPFARRLNRDRLGNLSVLSALTRLNPVCQTGTFSVTATEADALTARELAIPTGSPVLRTEAISLAADQRPVEYRVHLYRPDRFRLQWPVVIRAGATEGWSITQSGSMSF
jgi:GntR family transcriptional regulator